jgi:hypothetical protein
MLHTFCYAGLPNRKANCQATRTRGSFEAVTLLMGKLNCYAPGMHGNRPSRRSAAPSVGPHHVFGADAAIESRTYSDRPRRRLVCKLQCSGNRIANIASLNPCEPQSYKHNLLYLAQGLPACSSRVHLCTPVHATGSIFRNPDIDVREN